MHSKLLFLFLLLTNVFCFSQNTLIGKWKVIEVDANGIYYNVESDSIHVDKSFIDKFPDSESLQTIIDILREEYSDNTFTFTENEFIQKSPNNDLKSEYRLNETEKVIENLYKNVVDLRLPYEIITKEKLMIHFPIEEMPLKLILKKI